MSFNTKIEDVISSAAAAAKILESAKKSPAKKLAQVAAKKGAVENKGSIYKATRLGQEMTSEDPKVASFNLANFKKTNSEAQLKFMIQELVNLILAQFTKMELPMSTQAEMVAFAIKNFQKGHLFAAVDHAVFYAENNMVSK